jgi:hypothetical protein
LVTYRGKNAPQLSSEEVVTLINKGAGSGGQGRHW